MLALRPGTDVIIRKNPYPKPFEHYRPMKHFSGFRYTEDGDVTTLQRGHSVSYALQKLGDDRPDLHARVLAGEMTANAAMVMGMSSNVAVVKQRLEEVTSRCFPHPWRNFDYPGPEPARR
jgi:hypothetical protein